MADAASSPQRNKPKRQLRPQSQTVRERAEKAQIKSDKPPKQRKLKNATSGISKGFQPVKGAFSHGPLRLVARLGHYIGLVLFPPYFRGAWQELRLVQWPNRKQSRQLTFAVLSFAIVFGAMIAIVDYGLDKIFKAILLK